MENSEKELLRKLETFKYEVIDIIFEHIKRINILIEESDVLAKDEDGYDSIRFLNNIFLKNINEQESESIAAIQLNAVSTNSLTACVEGEVHDYNIHIHDVPTEKLCQIVGQLELFQNFEDFALQLM